MPPIRKRISCSSRSSFGGNGTLRVYVDEAASSDQRRELEAIFSGNKGGHLAALLGTTETILDGISSRVQAVVAMYPATDFETDDPILGS